MSKSAFAELLGVSHTAISNWENCVNIPDTKSLLTIGKMLGYGIDDLLSLIEGKQIQDNGNRLPELIGDVRRLRDKKSIYEISEAVNEAWLNAV